MGVVTNAPSPGNIFPSPGPRAGTRSRSADTAHSWLDPSQLLTCAVSVQAEQVPARGPGLGFVPA